MYDLRITIKRSTVDLLIPVAEKSAVSVAQFDCRRNEPVRDQRSFTVDKARTGHRHGPNRCIDPFVAIGDRQRILTLAHIAADADFQGSRPRQIEIHVRPIIIAVVAVIIVVIEVFRLFQHAVLIEIPERNEITHVLTAARNVDIILRLQKNTVEHLILPPDVRIHNRIGTSTISLDGLPAEILCFVSHAVVLLFDIPEAGILIAASLLDIGKRLLYTCNRTDGD